MPSPLHMDLTQPTEQAQHELVAWLIDAGVCQVHGKAKEIVCDMGVHDGSILCGLSLENAYFPKVAGVMMNLV